MVLKGLGAFYLFHFQRETDINTKLGVEPGG
jgi:hypothetical protein